MGYDKRKAKELCFRIAFQLAIVVLIVIAVFFVFFVRMYHKEISVVNEDAYIGASLVWIDDDVYLGEIGSFLSTGYMMLGYDTETLVVYQVLNCGQGISSTAYISENGNCVRYINGELVDIVD